MKILKQPYKVYLFLAIDPDEEIRFIIISKNYRNARRYLYKYSKPTGRKQKDFEYIKPDERQVVFALNLDLGREELILGKTDAIIDMEEAELAFV